VPLEVETTNSSIAISRKINKQGHKKRLLCRGRWTCPSSNPERGFPHPNWKQPFRRFLPCHSHNHLSKVWADATNPWLGWAFEAGVVGKTRKNIARYTSRFGNDIWPRQLSQRVVYNCCQPLRQCLSPMLRRVLFLKTKKCPSWEALTPEHCHHDHAPAVTPETRVFVQLRPHAPCCDARQQTLDGPVKMPTGP
jgi:hypothetical protein